MLEHRRRSITACYPVEVHEQFCDYRRGVPDLLELECRSTVALLAKFVTTAEVSNPGTSRFERIGFGEISGKIARVFWLSVILLLLPLSGLATDIKVQTPVTAETINAAIRQAVDGDTVLIPPTNATISSTIIIPNTKAITVQGAGISSTILGDAVGTRDSGGSTIVPQSDSMAAPARKGFNVHPQKRAAKGANLIKVSLRAGTARSPSTSKVTRITGIKFIDAGRTGTMGGNNGIIQVHGADQRYDGRFRMDHCQFGNSDGSQQLNGTHNFDTVVGVIDHCTMYFRPPWSHIYDKQWNGDPTRSGQQSWNSPLHWGGEDWLFFEDNKITATSKYGYGICDAYWGARAVFRYNSFYDVSVQTHGTETGAGPKGRGVAAIDMYSNDFYTIHNTGDAMLLMRSGVAVVHDNRTHNWPNARIALATYRTYMSIKNWGGADGSNQLDRNDFSRGGTNKDPTPFATGTAKASNGLVMTASPAPSPAWTPGQWKGYTLVNTDRPRQPRSVYFSVITNNGKDNITFHGGFGGSLAFTEGQHFKITRVLQAVDMTGVTGGTLQNTGSRIANVSFPDTSDPKYPGGKNDQINVGCWEWANKDSGGNNIQFANSNTPLIANCGASPAPSPCYYHNDATPPPSFSYGTPYPHPHPLTLSAGAPPMPTESPGVAATPTAMKQ